MNGNAETSQFRRILFRTEGVASLVTSCLALTIVLLTVVSSYGQRPQRRSAEPTKSTEASSANESIPSGIAWYGVLTDGLAEAKATNRPIFLMSAAPQCAGIPGMW